jgi:hypothetical protein
VLGSPERGQNIKMRLRKMKSQCVTCSSCYAQETFLFEETNYIIILGKGLIHFVFKFNLIFIILLLHWGHIVTFTNVLTIYIS